VRWSLSITMLVLLVACGEAHPAGKALSRDRVGPAHSAIVVSSSAFAANGTIDSRFTPHGANRSPPLSWTPVTRAASYALIVEDPDAPAAMPWVHWLIWNLPAGATALPEGVAPGANPALPAGATQGRGDADVMGYIGPRPPSGAHHYHFEVFALDRRLDTPPGATRDTLVAAMRGHVLASGELVGLYAAPGG